MKVDAVLMTADAMEFENLARRAEADGFAGVWSFEGPHDPFLPLTLAARATERVALGTAIAIAFARNPMTCAQLANDLQLISRGRFVLGLGTQIRPHIEKRFSQVWSRPNARMREFVAAIRAIWRCWNEGDELSFRGDFYTHTLMTPMFEPGANPFGSPPIFLAGFGPGMVKVAGEVADGWIVHPLHSREFLQAVTIPALEAGLCKSGRTRRDVKISAQTIVMIGDDDAGIAKARNDARAQIAFYSSTPAYKIALDHHGWGAKQAELNRLSKRGRWLEMIEYVDDDMLDTIGVSGTPAQVAAALRVRNDFADRTTLVAYNQSGPDAVAEIARALG